mmetsp:Transcript_31621/g.71906  ORF Transcript_31621/g.71906 Transcript_31621/m.71906 type:complete len:210 (+) Transcript_31621:275-904(+)
MVGNVLLVTIWGGNSTSGYKAMTTIHTCGFRACILLTMRRKVSMEMAAVSKRDTFAWLKQVLPVANCLESLIQQDSKVTLLLLASSAMPESCRGWGLSAGQPQEGLQLTCAPAISRKSSAPQPCRPSKANPQLPQPACPMRAVSREAYSAASSHVGTSVGLVKADSLAGTTGSWYPNRASKRCSWSSQGTQTVLLEPTAYSHMACPTWN